MTLVKLSEIPAIVGRKLGTVRQWKVSGHLVPVESRIIHGIQVFFYTVENACEVAARFADVDREATLRNIPSGHVSMRDAASMLDVCDGRIRKWFDSGRLTGKVIQSGSRMIRVIAVDSIEAFRGSLEMGQVANHRMKRERVADKYAGTAAPCRPTIRLHVPSDTFDPIREVAVSDELILPHDREVLAKRWQGLQEWRLIK